MLPLAMIVKAQGHVVAGSDRSRDQGRSPEKFAWLEDHGIALFDQDGSGVTRDSQTLVTSGAVEDTVPDVKAAIDASATRVTRPELLAQIFNAAEMSIGVAGTSGKSTTTGMIGWILHAAKMSPTVMNGAVMKNFISDETPFASAITGAPDLFVSEVDESDGSIALYEPAIAVLNNIAVDHKTLEELRQLFKDYVGKAATSVLNLDNAEVKAIAGLLPSGRKRTYSLSNLDADLYGKHLVHAPGGISFDVVDMQSGVSHCVTLKMPGAHNVSNALAALAATTVVGVPLATAAEALASFEGISRRLELVGTRGGITIIDDFAHNPDKIAASLKTLHAFDGRLLVFFQPHGFGPLAKMKDAFIEAFAQGLGEDDQLLLCEPVYYGGTVERAVTSQDIVDGVVAAGRNAEALPTRKDCGTRLKELATHRDRIIIMGARDDTLSDFARDLLTTLFK